MNNKSMIGTWKLTGSQTIESQISFGEEDEYGEREPDPNGVKNWLSGGARELVNQIDATTGLVLTINAVGEFVEKNEGKPKICWFDREGILWDSRILDNQEIIAFDGVIKTDNSGSYLLPTKTPSLSNPIDGRYGVVLRYDDGDTKVCDHVGVIDGKLVRTLNLVTDELYFTRTVLVYEN